MSTTALSSPVSFAQFGTAGVTATVFEMAELELAMRQDMDVEALGLLRVIGDLSGSGSSTLTSVFADDIGADLEFAPLATETSAPTPTAYTLGIDTVTVGMYGWSTNNTMQGLILGNPDRMLTMPKVIAQIPPMYRNTIKNLYTDVGATFSTAIGSAATALSVDNWLAMVAAIEQTPGANDSRYGMPNMTLHSVQLGQLKASARTEPAFKTAMDNFSTIQGVSEDYAPNWLKMGMNLVKTDAVGQSGGAYQGFVAARGAIVLARASFGSVVAALSALGTPPISGFADNSRGIFVFTSAAQAGSQVLDLTAFLMVGLAKVDPTRRFQRRFISVV